MPSTVTIKGPLFDKRAKRHTKTMTEAAVETVAEATENEILSKLGQSLKNPTGFYESRIRTDRTTQGAEVTDSGVIYGPWLEGVSSRNRTTRFKGYAAFRKSTQQMQPRVRRLVAPVMRIYTRRMNG